MWPDRRLLVGVGYLRSDGGTALSPAALIGKRKIPIFNCFVRNSAQAAAVLRVSSSLGFRRTPELGTDGIGLGRAKWG
jgi:hypothetical protein